MEAETAFPTDESNYEKVWSTPGMTLRDYFAAKAILVWAGNFDSETAARYAYEMADAMLRARGQ
ncbi:hypothetical protein ACTUSX_11465 [Pantoea ananatis]|uniref:hypothetical protein n=1 Tax=Pantoea ananas TaxID=553 RepID=UPI003FA4136D